MRWVAVACCPVLLAAEVYRRGYAAAVLFGCKQWARADWRSEPEMIG